MSRCSARADVHAIQFTRWNGAATRCTDSTGHQFVGSNQFLFEMLLMAEDTEAGAEVAGAALQEILSGGLRSLPWIPGTLQIGASTKAFCQRFGNECFGAPNSAQPQDSNLRARLRRVMLPMALTRHNAFRRVKVGSVQGADAGGASVGKRAGRLVPGRTRGAGRSAPGGLAPAPTNMRVPWRIGRRLSSCPCLPLCVLDGWRRRRCSRQARPLA
jgi:hypothetical protein